MEDKEMIKKLITGVILGTGLGFSTCLLCISHAKSEAFNNGVTVGRHLGRGEILIEQLEEKEKESN